MALVFLASIASFLLDAPPARSATLRVVGLTDAAGLGDKGFNDVCWKGVQEAAKEFGLKASFLQSREQADYLSNLSMAARNADVVVTLGFLYVDTLKQVAVRFPNTRFVHIEGDITGDNIAAFDFKSEEGGFLAGLVAGLFTKSMKVGAVSGMDIPPVEAYVCGFRAGVKTAGTLRKAPIEAIVASAGSFNDPVKGKSLAQALMDQGVDVIFRIAGNSGIGVMEAVRNADGVYLVAEDLDQDGELPGKILTSALKRMDVAIHDTLGDIVRGNFRGGHRWLGAAQGAVDITDMKYSRDLFDASALEYIRKARTLLKEGKLDVPKRYSEVEGFKPPSL
jgi:basic membrane protein A